MKIHKEHFINDLIKSNPIHYNSYKRLVMTERSLSESFKVIMKFEDNEKNVTLESIKESLLEITKTLKPRKFLLIDPKSNIIIEYEFNGIMFSVKLHLRGKEKIHHCFNFMFVVIGSGHLSLSMENEMTSERKNELDNFLTYINNVTDIPYEKIDTWFLSIILNTFIPQILYIELSKEHVRLKTISPRSKTGNIMRGDYVLNETKLSFNLVDSLWNIKSIGVGKFEVSGHFRFQRCGVGFSEVKLIYIEKFYKSQYIRKSTRELVFG